MTLSTLHLLVPAYGPSPYLAETLASAVAAADGSTMVTVVDDGSPGEEVARAAAGAGPGVEIVRLQRNRGVAGAFQACLELSRGDYTVFVGSDDLLEPDYVHQVRALVERFGAPAMALPGVTVIDAAGLPARPLADRVKRALAPRHASVLEGDRLAASLLLGNWLYFPALAWRTEVLRRYSFREDMQTALDLELELRVVFGGGRLAWSPQPAFRYRRHDSSYSSRTAVSGERFQEERELFRWAAGQASSLGWRRSALAARLHPTSRLHAATVRASALGMRRKPPLGH